MKKIDQLIQWGFRIIIFGVPLIFIPQIHLSYELPKVALFRSITLLIWFFILIKIILQKKVTLPKIKKSILLPLLGFILATIIATIFSSSLHISFFGSYDRQQGLFQILHYFLFFLAALIFIGENKKRSTEFVQDICLASIIISFIALLNVSSYSRIGGTLAQPAFLSSYLILTLPFFIFRAGNTGSKKKYFWYLFAAILVLTIILTGSRSALIGLVTIFIAGTIYFGKKKWLLLPILAITIISFLNIFSAHLPSDNKILNRFIFSGQSMQSIKIRALVWPASIKEGLEHPILGHGPEMLKEGFYKYQSAELSKLGDMSLFIDRAHNEPLDIFIQTGLIGLITYFLFFIFLIKESLSRKKEAIVFASITSLVSYLIVNLFNFSTTIHFIYWWLIVAILLVTISEKNITLKIKVPKFLGGTTILITSIIFFILVLTFNINPLYADYEYQKGRDLLFNMEHSKALIHYDKAIEKNPFEIKYYIFAAEHAFIRAGKNDTYSQVFLYKGAKYLDQIKTMNGIENLMQYNYLRGVQNEIMGNYETSMYFYNIAYEKGPEISKISYRIAKTLEKLLKEKSCQ